jgi:hypothetical protein
MNTHRRPNLLAAALSLALPLLMSTDASVSDDLTARARPSLCAWVAARAPVSGKDPSELAEVAAAIERGPEAYVTGVIGALGQMIVEAELSHAVITGRFEPVILASVAGTDFALEVCRDTIVGEVSVAQRPGVQFIIGDFDGDGATDVAVRRTDSPAWMIDLGALRRTRGGLMTPGRQLIEVAVPAARDPQGPCEAAWLAEGLRAGAGAGFSG